jgi:hypothetical protein
MMGFPKTIGCKQDILNLEKDFPKETMAVLERIEAFDKANSTIIKVVSGSEETKNLVTQTIANPALLSKKLGFKDVKEVTDKISVLSVAIAEVPIEEVIEDGK